MRKAFTRCGCLLLLAAGLCLACAPACAELRIHFIDVGQGDAILVECDGMFLLADAGSAEAGKTVHDYLAGKRGITRLDYVIATHEHDDHLGGMPEALAGLAVDKVYSGSSVPLTYWFTSVLPGIRGNAFSVARPVPGESFELGGAAVTFLDFMENTEVGNDHCLTFRIDYGENSALFMADLEGDGESFLLNGGADLEADILKVGHHGGNTSTGDRFLRAVNPRIAVISVGTGNKHGHPHREILARLDKYNVTVYRTDLFGTIVLSSDGKDWTVEVSKAR